MEYLTKKLHDIASIFLSSKEPVNQYREVSRFEVYLEYIFKILNWEEISLTCTAFLGLNFIFWLIVVWEIKIIAVIVMTVLCVFILDLYLSSKPIEGFHGQYTDVLDEFNNWSYDAIMNLMNFRKESPSSFCIGMSLMFLFLSFIARNISGYLLSYLVILGIFFIPLGIKFLPEHYKVSIKQAFRYIGSNKGLLAESELMPFISDKDFSNRDPELDSLLTDRTADSFTNGAPSMPSYLDVDGIDDIEEDDLLPLQTARTSTLGDLSSSETDSDNKGIHFESGHFNGDSSEEEENNYVDGLMNTTDVDTAQESKSNTDVFGILSNVASMGGSLMANVMKTVVQPSTTTPVLRKDSSSDSDFEMVTSDDVEEKST